jgi:hypothetical protein
VVEGYRRQNSWLDLPGRLSWVNRDFLRLAKNIACRWALLLVKLIIDYTRSAYH